MTASAQPPPELEARNDRDAFLASLGHDLRAPLGAILGLTEALRTNVYGPLQGRQDEILALIEASGDRLLEAINRLVDLAKVDAGRLELTLESVSAGTLAAAAERRASATQFARHLAVELATPATAKVLVDARRTTAMLTALLHHVAKFTGPGGTVTLSTTPCAGRSICFRVATTGPGVAARELRRLLSRFDQKESELAQQYADLALTMAWSNRIAVLQGGELTVEETPPGCGNVIDLVVPIARDDG